MKTAPHLPRREYTRSIADFQHKIQLAQEAKQKVQQHVQALHEQYAQGLLSYEAFDAKVKSFLKQKPLDAWLKYYDECIKVYEQHLVYCSSQQERYRTKKIVTTTIITLAIFLLFALGGLFLQPTITGYTAGADVIIEGAEHYRADDAPEFKVRLGGRGNLMTGSAIGLSKKAMDATLIDPQGREIPLDNEIRETARGFTITLEKERAFKAGRYKLRINTTLNDRVIVKEQDFTWGVLAINVDKSMYLENEDAFISMAVLDDRGRIVCDADISLEITDPLQQKTRFTTANGEISISKECQTLGVTKLPDYYTTYKVGEKGTYRMNLTAETKNGRRSIIDNFMVKEKVAFDIARDGPTRIYPLVPYTTHLTIKAQEDYHGMITEYVPASFVITPQDGLSVTTIGDMKRLAWKKNLVNGETYNIYYQFDAPDISPEFYLLGPLEIGAFKEKRQWQIASDATVIFLTTGTSWTVPTDWSNTNTIEVIGGGGGGRTGAVGGAGVGGRGGGGGAGSGYSKIVDTTSLTAGSTVTIAIGDGGTGGATPIAGTDTFLCSSTLNCASIAGTAVIVGSKGGGAGTTTAGGVGGAAASGVGTTKFSGGNGGDSTASTGKGGGGGGGGAGAGGTTAAGSNGVTGGGSGADDGVAGGAGGAGGTVSGGAGGTAGAAGIGGVGGIGGNGGDGTVFDPTHGAGGGSGGGGGGARSSNGGGGGTTAGLYGAGGGGGGGAGRDAGTGGAGAAGRQGLIIITYTPAGDVTPPKWWNVTINDTRIFLPNKQAFNFSTTWTDNINLSSYIFSINMNGNYQNSTSILFNGTWNISTNTTFVSVPRGGTNVTWFFFANDSSGNNNATAIQSFIVNTAPTVTSVTITPTAPKARFNNITASIAGQDDADLDDVEIVYNWIVNNKSLTVVNLPMTNALYTVGSNTTFDFSGLNNIGRLGAGTDASAMPLFTNNGSMGGAYDFDGVNDNITINHSQGISEFVGNFTIEAWVNITNLPASLTDTIIQKGTGTVGYRLEVTTTTFNFSVNDATAATINGNILTNRWYHVVGVWNGTNCMIYLNGSLKKVEACAVYTSSVSALSIGDGTGTPFDGLIDEVRIYNRSLTAAQIGAIYNAGIPGKPHHNITVAGELSKDEIWNISATPIDADGLNGSTVFAATTALIAGAPDAVPPTVQLLVPINATNSSASIIYFNFTAFDNAGDITNATLWGDWPNYIFKANNTNTTVVLNGSAYINNSINVTGMPEGNWTWNINVCDSGGNCVFNTTNFTITVDRTAPSVTNIQPVNNSVNTTSTFIDFFYNVTDVVSANIVNCTVTINNTQSFTSTYPTKGTRNNISVSLANVGNYNWTVGCFDQAGNNGNSGYFNFSIRISVISCTVSTESFNISFGDNVAQGVAYNASQNYAGYTGPVSLLSWTRYNVTNDPASTTQINVTILGDHLTLLGADPRRTIGIGNVSWNSSKISGNDTNMTYPFSMNLSTTADAGNPLVSYLSAGSTAWWRFWLNVPQQQFAGNYVGNYTVACVAT